jgi:NAD(P)-dependent dehydrogenase (short-subunit alcohol dehydrogenase family)
MRHRRQKSNPLAQEATVMRIADKAVLVTDANRGNRAGPRRGGPEEGHLAVNLFGTHGVTQAFLPLLTRSRGAIVNNVSMMAFAPMPLTPMSEPMAESWRSGATKALERQLAALAQPVNA